MMSEIVVPGGFVILREPLPMVLNSLIKIQGTFDGVARYSKIRRRLYFLWTYRPSAFINRRICCCADFGVGSITNSAEK